MTDDATALILKLHAARRESGDESLRRIVIARSRDKPNEEVLIMLKPAEAGDAQDNGQAT